MKNVLRKTHLVTGLVLLVIFPLTGAYLRFRIPHLMEESDRFRFSMRGNHIYILLSSLIHLSLGSYFKRIRSKWPGMLQTAGSAVLILSSAIILAAFFAEPKYGLDRPATLVAMVTGLTGTLLHVVCVFICQLRTGLFHHMGSKGQRDKVTE